MRIRQANKILARGADLNYRRSTIRAAKRTYRRCPRKKPIWKDGVKLHGYVILNTDVAFEREGVPVDVVRGGLGVVVEFDGFPQILCKTSVGLDVVGIPAERLQYCEKPDKRIANR